jgi:hypothetical protein
MYTPLLNAVTGSVKIFKSELNKVFRHVYKLYARYIVISLHHLNSIPLLQCMLAVGH